MNKEKKEILKLIKLSKTDIEIRNKFIMRYKGLVHSINRTYGGNEDSYQEGMAKLMEVVDKYDLNTGTKFSTYAYWWVRNAITRYMDRQRYNASFHIIEHYKRLRGYEGSGEDYVEKYKIKKETYNLAKNLQKESTMIEDWHTPYFPNEMELINKVYVEDLLKQLKEEERTLIEQIYLKNMPIRKVAELNNCSYQNIDAKKQRVLKKLRNIAKYND